MSKTPVSILQELMTKRGIVPHYELLETEGYGTHVPIFHYRVTVGEVQAFGKARSKKDAKHESAKQALEKLSELGIYHPEHISTQSSPVKVETNISLVKVNGIDTLKDFASENNIQQPEFYLISDVGPPHAPQFTIKCLIGKMETLATDSTKKKAKQLAAQKMYNRLIDSLPTEEELISNDCMITSTPHAISQDIIDGYMEHSQVYTKKKINYGLAISSYPTCIKKIMNEKNLSYNDVWKKVSNMNVTEFEDMMNTFELSFCINFMDNETDTIIALLAINSEPEFIVADVAESRYKAEQGVIQKAFEIMKILMK